MIFHDAMLSLKKDKKKAFFYWLLLLLTTLLVYLFFAISNSDPSVDPLHNQDNRITITTCIVIILCSIDILFANEYYVKLKSKDLAVRLLSGAKFTQTSAYLLIQTITLLLLSIPLGILFAYGALPMINSIMLQNGIDYHIAMSLDSVIQSTVVILYVVFWIVLLNFSFAYRNSVNALMNVNTVTMHAENSFIQMPTAIKIPKWLIDWFWVALLFVPILFFYVNVNYVFIASVISLASLYMILKEKVKPAITKWIRKKWISNPMKMASLGMVRQDTYVLKLNILLFIVSVVVFVALLTNTNGQPMVMMTILISFVLMILLQGMALMFRFGTEISRRNTEYRILMNNGCTEMDCHKIMHHEVGIVYGSVFLLTMLYVVNILVCFNMHGDISMPLVIVMIASIVVTVLMSYVITRKMYSRVLKESTSILKSL